MTELNDMGRTEDIALGLNLFASVGFAETSFGSDRDATLLRSPPRRVGSPAARPPVAARKRALHARRGRGLPQHACLRRGTYYRRNLERLSVLGELEHARDRRPRPRIPSAARRRQRSARLSDPLPSRREPHDTDVEQRFFTDFYPWRLFRVGWAVSPTSAGSAAPIRALAAPRHALRRRRRVAFELAARERPQRRAYRSRVPAERRSDDRQRAIRHRDERLVLKTRPISPGSSV